MSRMIELKQKFDANKSDLTKEKLVGFSEKLLDYVIKREAAEDSSSNLFEEIMSYRDHELAKKIDHAIELIGDLPVESVDILSDVKKTLRGR